MRDGLLEIVRTEESGKLTTEWVRLTPAGVSFLHAHESPRAVLEALEREKGKRGKKPPFSLGDAIVLVAKQGGYLARGSDPPPGAKCIWKGVLHLYDLTAGYRLAAIRAGP